MFPAALSVLGAAAIQERPLKPSFYCSFFCMFETLKFGSHRNFLAANKETIKQADFRELSSESTLTLILSAKVISLFLKESEQINKLLL